MEIIGALLVAPPKLCAQRVKSVVVIQDDGATAGADAAREVIRQKTQTVPGVFALQIELVAREQVQADKVQKTPVPRVMIAVRGDIADAAPQRVARPDGAAYDVARHVVIAKALIDRKAEQALSIQAPIVGESSPFRYEALRGEVANQEHAARGVHHSAAHRRRVRPAGQRIHPLDRAAGNVGAAWHARAAEAIVQV